MIIGVDFDNTIVSYDELIYGEAIERGLVDDEVLKSKKIIRDTIRELPEGEIEWQKIQAAIYGPQMERATLIEDVFDFFILCREKGVRTYIVSHKTQFANYDTTGTDLRKEALKWLDRAGFFDAGLTGLSARDVYFESTRVDKINRIMSLGCTHFIDDLEETFREPSFPPDIEKILFNSQVSDDFMEKTSAKVFTEWNDIRGHLFNGK
jgi:hypothetical protein